MSRLTDALDTRFDELDEIKDVITNNWDKSSSGLGDHYYVDSENITDPDELQEYWEEYSV